METLNVNGMMTPHTIVSIIGDGACLFRAISYCIYGDQLLAREMREQIVEHVVDNWEEFAVLSCDRFGNNYASAADYFADMSLLHTYGSLCELVAAGQIFPFVFEVYRNGVLYAKFGNDANPVFKLRFTNDLSSGHFDVYLPYDQVIEDTPPTQRSVKRRARFTDVTKKKQRQIANKIYSSKPTSKATKAIYQKVNSEIHKADVAKYQEINPEVHRASAAKYQKNKPEVHRLAVGSYYRRNLDRVQKQRNLPWKTKVLSGFMYDPKITYETDKSVVLGDMKQKCQFCNAFKWKEEASGMCCKTGKVQLLHFETLPEPLYSLIMNLHPDHVHFMDRIRKYNGCFQMTSFGAKKVIESGFMPTFKVQGQVYHLIGSLLPSTHAMPQFLQIYFVGEDERETRLRCSNFPGVKQGLVKQLQSMLHDSNKYIKNLKTTMDRVPKDCNKYEIVIHADKKPFHAHRGRFNAPTTDEVALVMVGQEFERRDIILQNRDGNLQRISELHRSYDALQYPVLFCRGEDGYSVDIPQCDPVTKLPLKKTVSASSFYSYRIMIRPDETNHILQCRSLFCMFLVDIYAKIETERLNFIRANQAQLRADNYIHLKDAIGRQDCDAAQLGQMVVLPSSFTGGPRYMHEKTQDAMTYVRHYGRPDLFITFTCNPRWADISKCLLSGQKPYDRPDIIARVFHLKVKKMINILIKGKIFGEVRCYMYSVEWQKRGLPHIHILLWLIQRITPDAIDKVISAEIPDPDNDRILYEIVKSNMIHGPCGTANSTSPCMKNNICSKKYPMPLHRETQTGKDGYPLYRRRSPDDGGFTVNINGNCLDNRWVVPYNPVLLKTFNSHINIEYCNSVKSIKYVCKYINKGSDQATFALENKKDEVKIYESGRYISSTEAVWRILGFLIHERFPTVVHLAVHLENGQRIYFNPQNLVDKLNNPKKTTLLAFFKLCQKDDFAKTLLYFEVPAYYVWNNNTFERRKRGIDVEGWSGVKKDQALGRVYTVHPNNAECYYLRMLLHVIRGPTSFEVLKMVDGVLHPTFQSACKALRLIEDDEHWCAALEEAVFSQSPFMMRELFSVLLVHCQVSDPLNLWDKFKEHLSEDFRHQVEKNVEVDVDQFSNDIFNKCLLSIEESIQALGGRTLREYGLPQPSRVQILENREYLRETNYNLEVLTNVVARNEYTLTAEQKIAYDEIITTIEQNAGGIFFLDAPGALEKHF